MPRWMKRSFMILGIILLLWLIMAQSCMKMRISDSKAKEQFLQAGVELQTPVKARYLKLPLCAYCC